MKIQHPSQINSTADTEGLVDGLTANRRSATDKLLMDYLTGTSTTPKHLSEFGLLYQRLKTRGTFEVAKKELETNKDLPPMIRDYGKTLLSLMIKERKLERKYEFFTAFRLFFDYLAGDLGKR